MNENYQKVLRSVEQAKQEQASHKLSSLPEETQNTDQFPAETGEEKRR